MNEIGMAASTATERRRGLLAQVLRENAGGIKTYPPSFAQERLWFLNQFQPNLPTYVVGTAMRLPQAINPELLRRALDAVVERHEALRTSFPSVNGRPVQLVVANQRVPLSVIDLSGRSAREREEEARAILAADAARSFDLATGPLLAATLISLAPADHVLALTMHHIVSDAWSMGVLLNELAALYDAFGRRRPAPLPPLPIQYGDFAAWQRQHLSGPELERHLAYWRQCLDGVPAVLQLPADKVRPPVMSGLGASRSFGLGAPVAAALREIARAEGATPFMVLLAAFLAMLRRYTGQEDLVVGSPIAGRTRTEVEGLIGFFVNTLVLRADLGGNPSFRQLVARVRSATIGAYAHQDLPFEKLVAELQPERDVSRNPLFQVAFGLENTQRPRPAPGGPGATEGGELTFGTSKFDLTMMLSETAGGFAGTVEYSTDLFEHESIVRLIGHFKTLVTAAVAAPDQPLSRLPMATDDERRRLVADFNATARPLRADAGLHGLIAAQAARTPDAPAVVADDARLTYRELDREANRLAHELIAMGVAPGAIVGICLPRGAAFLVAALASLKAGAAYLPLDPAYPEERLRFMLEDTAAPVLIAAAATAVRLPRSAARTLLIDGERARIEARPDMPPPVPFDPRGAAYVIYTSGSTGRPKASLVAHDAFANLVTWYADDLGLDGGDAALIVSALGFDLTQKNLFAPLTVGARVHLHGGEVFDPDEIARLVDRHAVTLINCTPSAFYPVADAAAASGTMRALRFAVLGGEPIALRRIWPWLSRFGVRAQIVNSYGPTECTDVVATYRVEDPASLLDRPVPIGRPVPNARLYALDEQLEPCPVNVIGELYVGGLCVSHGYVGRPGATAEAFLPDPFAETPGRRLYRTGDLARMRPDGTLEYLGRIDHQVKVRGFRIELGEIETALLRHPAIEQAAVLALSEGGGSRLCGFIVPRAEVAGPARRLAQLERDGRLEQRQLGELPNGFTVVAMNRAETDFLYREIFTARTYLQHGVTLADGDCVFDVGGNTGLFALFAAGTVDHARIYSFEPIPPLAEALRLNAAIHDLPVEVMQYGLASAPGTDTFSYYPHVTIVSGRAGGDDAVRRTMRAYLQHQDGGMSVSADALEELVRDRLEVRRFDCRLKTLSQAIRETGVERIDLLKIDVEKSELDVLLGLAEADWPRIRQVVVEVHDIDGTLARIDGLLARHGFDVHVAAEDALRDIDIYMVYGVRPAARREAAVPAPARQRWNGREALLQDLRAHLRRHLPDHMVPSSLALLDAVPLTPNGKVDRRRLQALAAAGVSQRRASVPPRAPLEHVVCGIMQEVLGSEEIGVHDSFFELGGHSLLATQVTSRLRDALQMEIPLRLLFEQPTGAGLAQAIAADPDTGALAQRTAETLLELAAMDEAEVARRLQAQAPASAGDGRP